VALANRAKIGMGKGRRQLEQRARDILDVAEHQGPLERQASDEPRRRAREDARLGIGDEQEHAERLVEIERTRQLARAVAASRLPEAIAR